MEITDFAAIKVINRVRSDKLNTTLSNYPESERNGRLDMEIVKEKLAEMIKSLDDSRYSAHKKLTEAKHIMNTTKSGKDIPINLLTNLPKYTNDDIQNARDMLNEYERIKRWYKKI